MISVIAFALSRHTFADMYMYMYSMYMHVLIAMLVWQDKGFVHESIK